MFLGDQRFKLAFVEEKRIGRVFSSWPESSRNSYALNCWAVLAHVGLASRPGKCFDVAPSRDSSAFVYTDCVITLCSESRQRSGEEEDECFWKRGGVARSAHEPR